MHSRRDFIKQSSLTLAYTLAGSKLLLSPAEARDRAVPFTSLSKDEVETLEAVCEILLPGAADAGVAHFVDHQLGEDPNDSLLVLKYFNYPPPYAGFYQVILKEIARLSERMFGKAVNRLTKEQARELVLAFRDSNPEGWQGPPAMLAYLALRNDATDVFYGTPDGFEKLGIPYMEHILPPEGWS